MEGLCLHRIKGVYEKPTANNTFNGKELSHFPVRTGKDKDVRSPHSYPTPEGPVGTTGQQKASGMERKK